eukprot:TRINITY_DN60982_c0_g1_i1.p1 TRINITY_DN60982_c0_g1~~TRINITY_DN60982_c0_g1_i1.p1  ORF type:complete len:351 (+),score=108.80 TRINITY_DN60982_c0_g1_i1:98-1150(+)
MQRGVRYLRRVRVHYDPGVPYWEPTYGGVKEWVDEWLPKWKERNPGVDVQLVPLTDVREMVGNNQSVKVTGEYITGAVTTWMLGRYSAESIEMAVNQMRNTCNDHEDRPHEHVVLESEMESVQGMWTPYLWMRDRPEPANMDWKQCWQDELRDIAKYVRQKKQQREKDFATKYWMDVGIKKRMQKRWDEQVFPYTVGPETRAVPGRLFLEDTKTIFQDSGSTPSRNDLEPGGGAFMGGFVSPYRGGEEAAAPIGGTGTGDTNKFDAKRGGAGAVYNVPPFAGAPFKSGYGDYENFWQNWDLFHHSSTRYAPGHMPAAAHTDVQKRNLHERKRAEQYERKLFQSKKWDNES